MKLKIAVIGLMFSCLLSACSESKPTRLNPADLATPIATPVANIADASESLHLSHYLWSFDSGAAIRSTATISGDSIYFGTREGKVHALNLHSGSERWSVKTGGAVNGQLLAADNRIVFASGSGHIIALDAGNGDEIWRIATGREFASDDWDYYLASAILAEDTLYIGSTSGMVYGLALATGDIVWQYDIGSAVHTRPALVGDHLYISAARGLHCLSIVNGNQVWAREMDMPTSPAVSGNIIVVGSRDTVVSGFHAVTGELLWTIPHGTSWVTGVPVIQQGIAYIGSSDDQLFQAIDIDTGKVLWEAATGGNIFSAPVIVSGIAWVNSGDAYHFPGRGFIKAFDAKGETLLSLAGNNFFSTPVTRNGVLYLGSDNGFFYAVAML